jgi:hypothetical protein
MVVAALVFVSHVEVAEELVGINEEVVAVELIIGRCRVFNSRAQALLKYLIAPHPYRSTRGKVPEAYCLVGLCTPKDGMRKTNAAGQGSERR